MSQVATASTPADAARRPARSFRLQAYVTNPVECGANDRGNLVESQVQHDRKRACQRVRLWLRTGYWVEVFDNDSGELVAGPFDPEQAAPAYIV